MENGTKNKKTLILENELFTSCGPLNISRMRGSIWSNFLIFMYFKKMYAFFLY